jgi:hypothetical protein
MGNLCRRVNRALSVAYPETMLQSYLRSRGGRNLGREELTCVARNQDFGRLSSGLQVDIKHENKAWGGTFEDKHTRSDTTRRRMRSQSTDHRTVDSLQDVQRCRNECTSSDLAKGHPVGFAGQALSKGLLLWREGLEVARCDLRAISEC